MIDKLILDGFKEESNQLMEELVEVVEKLEQRSATFPQEYLEQFAQRIDRVMGASKTISQMDPAHLGLQRISKIAELCKRMGYMAAESKNPKVVPLFAAFWADTVEVLQELLDALEDPVKTEALAKSFLGVLQGRLEWLAKQVAATQGKTTASAVQAPKPHQAEKAQAAVASKTPAAASNVEKKPVDDTLVEEADEDDESLGLDALMKELDID